MRTSLFLPSTIATLVGVAAACGETTPGTSTSTTGGVAFGTGGSSGTPATGGSTSTIGGSATGGTATGGTTPTAGSGPKATGGTTTNGGAATGGTSAGAVGTGGTNATGGAGPGGTNATGGTATGGASAGSAGKAEATGGASTGGTGTGGSAPTTERPCDIYKAANTPCVGAYSTIRRVSSAYSGPLYQVRSGSSAQNTGSGGTTHDIGQTADGFADADAQDAACAGTICTFSLLYDQSGNENHLPVAKRGRSDGGEWADDDDFETIADEDEMNVGGHRVYSLFMDIRQGYRLTREGEGVPLGTEPQGIYMLADGTHYGTACCWDFGNVSPDPTRYGVMNTLFFGVAFWGRGADNGPWFMADYEAGVWAGGSNPGDPGWGALNEDAPPNQNNPSLPVPFALGFLKTNQSNWSLRMADAETATSLTTAYSGGLPKDMNNEGAIVIGVGGDNSNNSWGTFYEGAVVAGFPSDDAELAVLQNVKAAGYGE